MAKYKLQVSYKYETNIQEAIVDACDVNHAKAIVLNDLNPYHVHMDDILHVGTEYQSIKEIDDRSAIKDDNYTHTVTMSFEHGDIAFNATHTGYEGIEGIQDLEDNYLAFIDNGMGFGDLSKITAEDFVTDFFGKIKGLEITDNE